MLAIEVLLVNSVPIIANKMIITRADSLAFGTTSPRTSPISFDSPDFWKPSAFECYLRKHVIKSTVIIKLYTKL
jgi:hypothetical protein